MDKTLTLCIILFTAGYYQSFNCTGMADGVYESSCQVFPKCRHGEWYCQCFNCTGMADGVYESSCQVFTKCLHGELTKITCDKPLVVNEEKEDCDDPINVSSPCGVFRDCSFRDDGAYPEEDYNCQWYFMCNYEIFYGHSKCAPGLVWNTKLQTCDFPRNVPPPCGTKRSD